MEKELTEKAIDAGLTNSELVLFELRKLKEARDLQEGRVSLKDIYASLGLECSETELEIGEMRHITRLMEMQKS